MLLCAKVDIIGMTDYSLGMSNVHVSINPSLLSYVQDLIDSGDFNSKSEVFNQALRLMRDQDVLYNLKVEKLKQELKKGAQQLDSGQVSNLSLEEMFAKASREVQSRSTL